MMRVAIYKGQRYRFFADVDKRYYLWNDIPLPGFRFDPHKEIHVRECRIEELEGLYDEVVSYLYGGNDYLTHDPIDLTQRGLEVTLYSENDADYQDKGFALLGDAIFCKTVIDSDLDGARWVRKPLALEPFQHLSAEEIVIPKDQLRDWILTHRELTSVEFGVPNLPAHSYPLDKDWRVAVLGGVDYHLLGEVEGQYILHSPTPDLGFVPGVILNKEEEPPYLRLCRADELDLLYDLLIGFSYQEHLYRSYEVRWRDEHFVVTLVSTRLEDVVERGFSVVEPFFYTKEVASDVIEEILVQQDSRPYAAFQEVGIQESRIAPEEMLDWVKAHAKMLRAREDQTLKYLPIDGEPDANHTVEQLTRLSHLKIQDVVDGDGKPAVFSKFVKYIPEQVLVTYLAPQGRDAILGHVFLWEDVRQLTSWSDILATCGFDETFVDFTEEASTYGVFEGDLSYRDLRLLSVTPESSQSETSAHFAGTHYRFTDARVFREGDVLTIYQSRTGEKLKQYLYLKGQWCLDYEKPSLGKLWRKVTTRFQPKEAITQSTPEGAAYPVDYDTLYLERVVVVHKGREYSLSDRVRVREGRPYFELFSDDTKDLLTYGFEQVEPSYYRKIVSGQEIELVKIVATPPKQAPYDELPLLEYKIAKGNLTERVSTLPDLLRPVIE